MLINRICWDYNKLFLSVRIHTAHSSRTHTHTTTHRHIHSQPNPNWITANGQNWPKNSFNKMCTYAMPTLRATVVQPKYQTNEKQKQKTKTKKKRNTRLSGLLYKRSPFTYIQYTYGNLSFPFDLYAVFRLLRLLSLLLPKKIFSPIADQQTTIPAPYTPYTHESHEHFKFTFNDNNLLALFFFLVVEFISSANLDNRTRPTNNSIL